jgi:hypothetical protein
MLFHWKFSEIKNIFNRLFYHSLWGVVIVIIFSLIGNLATVQYIYSLQNDLQHLYKNDLIGQNYIQSARIELFSIDQDLNHLFLAKDTLTKNNALTHIASHTDDLKLLLKKSKSLYHSRKGRLLLEKTGPVMQECQRTIDTLVSLSRQEETDKASGIIFGAMKDRFGKLDSMLDNLDNIKVKHDITLYKNIDYGLTISILFTVIMLVLTIVFKIFNYRALQDHDHTGTAV